MDPDGFMTPYWAFPWSGGVILARHIWGRPDTVAGKRVVDIGTGSGLVAIAAALAGAASVTGQDIDPYAIAAAGLNAAANGVSLMLEQVDPLNGDPSDAEVILVGDLFYDADTARRLEAYLRRCAGGGATVLVGDPGRAALPASSLERIGAGDPTLNPAGGVYQLLP